MSLLFDGAAFACLIGKRHSLREERKKPGLSPEDGRKCRMRLYRWLKR